MSLLGKLKEGIEALGALVGLWGAVRSAQPPKSQNTVEPQDWTAARRGESAGHAAERSSTAAERDGVWERATPDNLRVGDTVTFGTKHRHVATVTALSTGSTFVAGDWVVRYGEALRKVNR